MTEDEKYERELAEIRRITEAHGYRLDENDDMSVEEIEAATPAPVAASSPGAGSFRKIGINEKAER